MLQGEFGDRDVQSGNIYQVVQSTNIIDYGALEVSCHF